MMHVERVSERPDMLGESPVWDARDERLFWVDGVSRLIRSYRPSSGVFEEWSTPSMVGSVALGQGNSLVVGLVDGIYSYDLSTGDLAPLLLPDPADPKIRFNDGKIDRFNRFVCGSMGIHADPLGELWLLDQQGKAIVLSTGIRISNALCFSPDGRTMYFADSLERKIRAYPYGADIGDIGAPSAFVDTDTWSSGPDGATVDEEGCLWVCLIQAGRIARFTPDGKLDRMIDAPTDLPSSLAFGGANMETLYVTSIKDSGTGRAVSRHPMGGCLFSIQGLGVRGLPEQRFGLPGNSIDGGEA